MRRRFNEANDSDLILNSIYELTHGFNGDGDSVASFFNINEITDNYGLSEKEVIDIAENNGYNVYRIPGGEDLVNFTVIAHEDLSYDDVIKGIEVDIKELGDDTEDSFSAEENYMEDYNAKDLYQDLKYDTENFTRSCTLTFDDEKRQLEARKLLLKHYDYVFAYANTYGHHQVYFLEVDDSKKAMREGALDDMKVASSHHLVKLLDMNRNLIKQKLFRSRPEVDAFIEQYNDVLFDMKIDNDETEHLDNGKEFFGKIYTVIIDKKDESLKEDVDNSLIGKKVNYKDEEHVIDDVIEEDEGVYFVLDNGKTISINWCVDRGIISSEDANVNNLLNRFKHEEESENDVVEPKNEFDPFKDASKQGTIDAQEDWEMYKPKASPMYDDVKKALKSGDFKNIPTAQPEKYAKSYKDEYDKLKDNKRIETTLSKYVGFIADTYKGNVQELISWFRSAITSIDVSCGQQMLHSVERKVKYFDDRDGTNTKIYVPKNKQWSSWTAILTSKEDILKDMPKEVLDWVVEKNSGVSIDDYEPGKVYNQASNYISSNPVVIDLLYEFNFKLGSQSQNEELGVKVDEFLDENLTEKIEKHEELNPKLFEDDELKPDVKEAIKNIADQFVKELNDDGIHFVLKDIVLLGSNVSYNYTKDSDLDIHLIADSSGFECPQELYDKLYSAYRSIFNKNYDITLKGIPAEIYVELDEPRAKSNGIYSLNSGWIKHPEQQAIPDIDKEAFEELFAEWEDRYFDLIGGIKNED